MLTDINEVWQKYSLLTRQRHSYMHVAHHTSFMQLLYLAKLKHTVAYNTSHFRPFIIFIEVYFHATFVAFMSKCTIQQLSH